jgi:hypothetical protein
MKEQQQKGQSPSGSVLVLSLLLIAGKMKNRDLFFSFQINANEMTRCQHTVDIPCVLCVAVEN